MCQVVTPLGCHGRVYTVDAVGHAVLLPVGCQNCWLLLFTGCCRTFEVGDGDGSSEYSRSHMDTNSENTVVPAGANPRTRLVYAIRTGVIRWLLVVPAVRIVHGRLRLLLSIPYTWLLCTRGAHDHRHTPCDVHHVVSRKLYCENTYTVHPHSAQCER